MNACDIAVFVVGDSGRVGRKFVTRLVRRIRAPEADQDLRFRLAGRANTRRIRWAGSRPVPRRPGDWPEVLAGLARESRALLVDCTADAGVAALYPELLGQGIGVVTPNKLAFAQSYAHHRRLHALAARSGAPLRYETTVGAALPVLQPLRELARRGERPTRIEAVLSGTLSFVFGRVNSGAAFSDAVREACDRGFSEPHPARDLSGRDTLAKMVIVLRAAGIAAEPDAIAMRAPLPPGAGSEADPVRFIAGLACLDRGWSRRVRAGALVWLARYARNRVTIGPVAVARESEFASLAPGANLINVYTRLYSPLPLTVAGPGAGPALTAAGLLSDLIRAGTAFAHGSDARVVA